MRIKRDSWGRPTAPSRYREARAKARRLNQVHAARGRDFTDGWLALLARIDRVRAEERADRAMSGLNPGYQGWVVKTRAVRRFYNALRKTLAPLWAFVAPENAAPLVRVGRAA